MAKPNNSLRPSLFDRFRALFQKRKDKKAADMPPFGAPSGAYKNRFNPGALPPAYKARIRARRARASQGLRG
jgi:hypothetical protein